jgi:membrane dipeptidase
MIRYIILIGILSTMVFAQKRHVTDAEVARVQKSVLLIDTHNDITSATVDGLDIGKPSTTTNTDIPRLRQGGVGAQFFAAYVDARYVKTNQSAHRTLEMIDTIRTDIIGRYPDTFQLATTAREIETIHRHGKIAALIGIEGGHGIEDSPRLLRDYYRLGVRYMTLTHVNTNDWADSSGDIDNPAVQHHNGLTDFGKQVVREMNDLGMMIDISHVADKTFWDALAVSRAPLMASHSSCRALTDVPRNMTDEMIAALARKGGVIQINFNCGFLNNATVAREKIWENSHPNATDDDYKKAFASGELPRATLADVVAHIDHAVKVGGIDHVGLGSDFDGVPCTPMGLDDVSKFPNLTRALLEQGYSAKDIRKIYGGNLLRVMRAVERARSPEASF